MLQPRWQVSRCACGQQRKGQPTIDSAARSAQDQARRSIEWPRRRWPAVLQAGPCARNLSIH